MSERDSEQRMVSALSAVDLTMGRGSIVKFVPEENLSGIIPEKRTVYALTAKSL